ncbi:ubiquitin-protein transferase [Aureococcus anophagefferens]|nr:ubiquitin-protein transferase [Aureococcus anophagefferens]
MAETDSTRSTRVAELWAPPKRDAHRAAQCTFLNKKSNIASEADPEAIVTEEKQEMWRLKIPRGRGEIRCPTCGNAHKNPALKSAASATTASSSWSGDGAEPRPAGLAQGDVEAAHPRGLLRPPRRRRGPTTTKQVAAWSTQRRDSG